VRYVFVGENEREHYSPVGLEKFRLFMEAVYDQDGITLYRLPT
jgi:uncharacterized membrane protein